MANNLNNNSNRPGNDKVNFIVALVVMLVFGGVLAGIAVTFIRQSIQMIRDTSDGSGSGMSVEAYVPIVFIGVFVVVYIISFINVIKNYIRNKKRNAPEDNQREHTYHSHSMADYHFSSLNGKCPKCGSAVKDEDMYCPSCGCSLHAHPSDGSDSIPEVLSHYASQAEADHDLQHEEIPIAIGKMNPSPSFGTIVSFEWFKNPIGQIVLLFVPILFSFLAAYLLISKRINDTDMIAPVMMFVFAAFCLFAFVFTPITEIKTFNKKYLGKTYCVYLDRVVIKDGDGPTIQPDSIVIYFSNLDKAKETKNAFFLVGSKEYHHDGSYKKYGYIIPKDELSSSAIRALSYRVEQMKGK